MCSPQGTENSRSRPNAKMWERCGASVLKEELRILGVQRVVVIGKTSNADSFRNHVWTDLKAVVKSGKVSLLRSPSGREALVVPHPASRKGHLHSIRDDVVEVLASASTNRR